MLVNNDDGLQRLCELRINILNKHAPPKKKYAWSNQMVCLTEDLKVVTDFAITTWKTGMKKIEAYM